MEGSKFFLKLRRVFLMCSVSFGLCTGAIITSDALSETVKQGGSLLVKFKPNVSDAQIQDVADHYGARQVAPLSNSESTPRTQSAQWRILKFDADYDIQVITRRMMQDNRVDSIESNSAK